MTRVRLALAASAVLGLTITGVGVGFAGERSTEVRLSEFRISAPKRVTAGDNHLVVRNEGRVDHDLVVVRTKRAPEDLPIGLHGVAPELAGEIVFGEPHSDHGRGKSYRPRSTHHYPPGTTRSSSLVLSPGRYVLLCTLPGHYEQGQRAALVVRGSA